MTNRRYLQSKLDKIVELSESQYRAKARLALLDLKRDIMNEISIMSADPSKTNESIQTMLRVSDIIDRNLVKYLD